MSRAKAIVEGATYRALADAVRSAKVYQDAPQDEPGRLVILGDMKSFALPGKDGGDSRRVSLAIITIAEAEERAPLLACQEEVEAALNGQTIEAEGWSLTFEFEEDDAGLSDDGSSYVGVSSFTILALAP